MRTYRSWLVRTALAVVVVVDVRGIAGRWETSLEQVVPHPMPGVDSAFVIAGSDQRGTIFGAYDVSRGIGVSPWHWWDDVPARHQAALYVLPGRHSQGTPAVKYRGFFINDENPQTGTWAPTVFEPGLAPGAPGGLSHLYYAKVFELALRLKANYVWPAVWGRAFAEDDPVNQATATGYGIVMGTSHEAPMTCGIEEWNRHVVKDGAGNPVGDPYGGNGQWSYRQNQAAIEAYWTKCITRMTQENAEMVVTPGLAWQRRHGAARRLRHRTDGQHHQQGAADHRYYDGPRRHIGPAADQDAYYEFVRHQVKATANLYALRQAQFLNRQYAAQGRAATNTYADLAEARLADDVAVSNYYNTTLAGGKWQGWQTQTKIGYGDKARNGSNASWDDPNVDEIYPDLQRITVPAGADPGVAIDGSLGWWPDAITPAVLPTIGRYQTRPAQYIEEVSRRASLTWAGTGPACRPPRSPPAYRPPAAPGRGWSTG